MRNVWHRLRFTMATAMVAGLLLAGCGGGDSEVDALASDFCELISVFEGIDEDDFDALMEVMEELEALEADFVELERRFDESEVTDEELEAAVRAECPDAFEAFDGF